MLTDAKLCSSTILGFMLLIEVADVEVAVAAVAFAVLVVALAIDVVAAIGKWMVAISGKNAFSMPIDDKSVGLSITSLPRDAFPPPTPPPPPLPSMPSPPPGHDALDDSSIEFERAILTRL